MGEGRGLQEPLSFFSVFRSLATIASSPSSWIRMRSWWSIDARTSLIEKVLFREYAGPNFEQYGIELDLLSMKIVRSLSSIFSQVTFCSPEVPASFLISRFSYNPPILVSSSFSTPFPHLYLRVSPISTVSLSRLSQFNHFIPKAWKLVSCSVLMLFPLFLLLYQPLRTIQPRD